MRYLIILLCLSTSFVAKAHKPDLSSTLLVEQNENEWVLQVRAALTAFEYEIENRFGPSSYASPEEFQALVVQHFKDRMSIHFNDAEGSKLLNGEVKLGHETSLTFEISDLPASLETLSVMNSGFSAVPKNQSALMIVKKGFEREQFTLDKANNHKASLRLANSRFELINPIKQRAFTPFYIIFGALTATSFLIICLRKYKALTT